ncbi:IclR family transcriptional regulator [Mesorhizobium sp. M00.F.Ca.ET.151.01.1.1]|uniref:IclR family transcriptional regulator n=1 Tax=Mesorhizobium sp. TaxID=1871066 RepID=UPI001208C457|nr:IclR family transcriptional regulator [Mesorhizobium sp.]TGU94960.1 IclR family transcriptional regulator [Mesorhizobium sp. M00.F.Ca.ET.151.01.1.1]TIT34282.1 MAG: IclR family transcriptional regulator [Mesorhizobium sp.]TIU48233.1 MAG: IclR family transcriptional regulator [Mesorhizobium sp.]
MSTVGKAISLLELFTVAEPELGLSDLARRSGFDKATTRRLLVALTGHGLVEQDAATRHYRLGAGLSRLARIREARFPFLQTAVPLVRDLASATAETVHLSEYGIDRLVTVHVEHPARANRVNVDIGQLLPLHSTASGIVYLAFARDEAVKACLTTPLEAFTAHTLTEPAALARSMGEARERGYSICDQGLEEGVISVAAAILAADGFALGTIAVAAPKARTTAVDIAERGLAAVAAAREISMRLNGDNLQALRRQA